MPRTKGVEARRAELKKYGLPLEWATLDKDAFHRAYAAHKAAQVGVPSVAPPAKVPSRAPVTSPVPSMAPPGAILGMQEPQTPFMDREDSSFQEFRRAQETGSGLGRLDPQFKRRKIEDLTPEEFSLLEANPSEAVQAQLGLRAPLSAFELSRKPMGLGEIVKRPIDLWQDRQPIDLQLPQRLEKAEEHLGAAATTAYPELIRDIRSGDRPIWDLHKIITPAGPYGLAGGVTPEQMQAHKDKPWYIEKPAELLPSLLVPSYKSLQAAAAAKAGIPGLRGQTAGLLEDLLAMGAGMEAIPGKALGLAGRVPGGVGKSIEYAQEIPSKLLSGAGRASLRALPESVADSPIVTAIRGGVPVKPTEALPTEVSTRYVPTRPGDPPYRSELTGMTYEGGAPPGDLRLLPSDVPGMGIHPFIPEKIPTVPSAPTRRTLVRPPADADVRTGVRTIVPDDPQRYGILPNDPEYPTLRQPSGAPVRGTPISPDDAKIPDEVYHVTTNAPAVRSTGLLRASGEGGLGGDELDAIVSFTTDRGIANQLADDFRLVSEIANMPEDSLAIGERLLRQATEEGWGDWQGFRRLVEFAREGKHERIAKDWLTDYFGQRTGATQKRNPLLLGDAEKFKGWNPASIEVIPVPKSSLRTGAMVTDFDLANPVGLKEIRIYGDVSVARPTTAAPVTGVARLDSVVTGFREGASTKPLPKSSEIKDIFLLKPLSEFTDRLFHETDMDSASRFIHAGDDNMRDLFFANNADMARGQTGKGVLLEFSSEGVEGRINKIPGWNLQLDLGNAEFITSFVSPSAMSRRIISVTVEEGTWKAQRLKGQGRGLNPNTRSVRMAIKDWPKKINSDGSTTYIRPTDVPVTPTPTTAAPVAGARVAGRVDDGWLGVEAKNFKTPEAFVESMYAEPSYDLTPGVTRLPKKKITGKFHGTSPEAVQGILSEGKIEARVTKLDRAGQKSVSVSGSRDVAGSYGNIVFELDPKLRVYEPSAGVVRGDYYKGFEFRHPRDIPLSSVRAAFIDIGRAEGLETRIIIGWTSRSEPIYSTIGQVQRQLQDKGIKTYVANFSDKENLRGIWYRAQTAPTATAPVTGAPADVLPVRPPADIPPAPSRLPGELTPPTTATRSLPPYVPEAAAPPGGTPPPRNWMESGELSLPPGGGSLPPSGPLTPGGVPEPSIDPVGLVARFARFMRDAKDLAPEVAARQSEIRSERKKRIEFELQTAAGPEARAQAYGAASGEFEDMPTLFEAPSSVFTQGPKSEMEYLRGMIQNRFQKDGYSWLPADNAFQKLFFGKAIPTQRELELLEEVFGGDFVNSILSRRAISDKAFELFLEVWNIPKALTASWDVSAMLRQGALLAMEGNEAKDALIAQLKSIRSEAGFNASVQRVVDNPWYDDAVHYGLDLTLPRKATSLEGREEPYIGARLAEKIPFMGQGIKISNRAYTAFLNEQRMSVFAKTANEMVGASEARSLRAASGQGRTGLRFPDVGDIKLTRDEAPTEADFKKLAWNINIMSGRGSLGQFSRGAMLLNIPLFSPRFFMSRIQIPLILATRQPELRNMAVKNLYGYMGVVFTMLSLAHLSGVGTVEWDRRSTDFGKLRIGNTRLDPWAGMQQLVVTASQTFPLPYSTKSEKKILATGEIRPIDPWDRATSFLEYKLSPTFAGGLALLRRKNFAGEDLTPTGWFASMVAPMTSRDLHGAIDDWGAAGGLGGGALSAMGVGVNTFGEDIPDYTEDFREYFAIPTDPDDFEDFREQAARRGEPTPVRRATYRAQNPDVTAKLFIAGHLTSVDHGNFNQVRAIIDAIVDTMKEDQIDPDAIESYREYIEERDRRIDLGRERKRLNAHQQSLWGRLEKLEAETAAMR